MDKMPKTKIICTIGPASNSYEEIEKLFLKGMSIARLNTSHGTFSEYSKCIQNIRKVEKKYEKKISIALDTKGPEQRIFCVNKMSVEKNEKIQILPLRNFIPIKGSIGVAIESLGFLEEGDLITIDDSKLFLKVVGTSSELVNTIALNSYILPTNKKIHFPNYVKMNGYLSPKDIEDIKFAIENKIDLLFLSFVESKTNLLEVREFLGKNKILIFSKIESKNGISNLQEISEFSDGLMVARGDLLNDVGIDKMFSMQKKITAFCSKLPVIMATETLFSMVSSIVPTRAEISDVGNAVLDGCYGIMLSSETAVGEFPDSSVDVLRRICLDAEQLKQEKEINKSS